jgi:hypothetical protein
MTDSPENRQAQLRAIVAKLPGRTNADRLRECAALLHMQPNTIRGWLLAKPYRHVPERQLRLLRDAVAKRPAA